MSMVSVIIPTYNREKTIRKAIESVLIQTYSDFKIIIVDDGSNDNTENIVRNINDDRIFFHKLKENGGASNARNVGAQLADTEWIAFQDSDDIWDKYKLEEQINYARENPGYDMIYCGMNVSMEDKTFYFPGIDIAGKREGNIFDWLIRRNTIGTPTMLIKRSSFNECGGFDVTLKCIEDWEFVTRFSKKYQIGYVEKSLVYTEIKDGGVSSNIGSYYITRCKMIVDNRDILIKNNMFDEVVMDMFSKANSSGVLEQVQQILVQTLKQVN